MAAGQASMTVTAAVRRELTALRRVDKAAAESALAADALALARRIDDPETSAASVASCSRALMEVVATLRLRGMAEEEKGDEKDRLDELAERREKRGSVKAPVRGKAAVRGKRPARR